MKEIQASTPVKGELTSRLLKGGALLSDMRLLVSIWSDDIKNSAVIPSIARMLPKHTISRVEDTYLYAFKPRFIEGSPSNAWRLARALEDAKADVQIIRQFYYWITARAELPLYLFATEVVYPYARSLDRRIRTDEAIAWLARKAKQADKSWSHSVTERVAQGFMAALRDFGILEGKNIKRISSVNLLPHTFALIAFCLNSMNITGRKLVEHTDWRLFLLGEKGVEHLFVECQQHGWLRFESAGKVYRIEFPQVTFKEYVDAVIGRVD